MKYLATPVLALAALASSTLASSPACSMPAQGCETGLDPEPRFCIFDPGPGQMPNYNLYYNYPYASPPDCPAGQTMDWACYGERAYKYRNGIDDIDTWWRQRICACQDQYPEDPYKRELCWHYNDVDMDTLAHNWLAYITQTTCCAASP